MLIDIAAAGVKLHGSPAHDPRGLSRVVALPLTPGVEASGRIAAVGGRRHRPARRRPRRLWYYAWGSYATQVIAHAAAMVAAA